MSVTRGICDEPDSRVIEGVEFGKSVLTCESIDSVTEVKCGKDGHLYQSEFSGGSESVTVSIKETEFGPDLGLQMRDVMGKGKCGV